MSLHKKAFGRAMSQPRLTDVLLDELPLEEQERVSGGRDLGKSGFFATTALEALGVLSGANGQVMVVVDGVIMNKDQLGLI